MNEQQPPESFRVPAELGLLVSAASKMLARTIAEARSAIDTHDPDGTATTRKLKAILDSSTFKADERTGAVLRGIPKNADMAAWVTWTDTFNRAENGTVLSDAADAIFERLDSVRRAIDDAVVALGDSPLSQALSDARRVSGRALQLPAS